MDGGVATGCTNPRPDMQQRVIGVVLADDEPRVGVLGVLVWMMHFSLGWEWASNGVLGTLSMQQFRRTDA